MHFSAGPPEPDHTELRFCALILEIDNVTGLELGTDALQGGAAAADGAEAGRLREGAGVGVHAPDFDGKLDENALLAAAVHGDDGRRGGRGHIGNRGYCTEVPKVRRESRPEALKRNTLIVLAARIELVPVPALADVLQRWPSEKLSWEFFRGFSDF